MCTVQEVLCPVYRDDHGSGRRAGRVEILEKGPQLFISTQENN